MDGFSVFLTNPGLSVLILLIIVAILAVWGVLRAKDQYNHDN